jgi:hypothetical protein
MQFLMPMKARALPMGWLILRGLTVQAFWGVMTLAMGFPQAAC